MYGRIDVTIFTQPSQKRTLSAREAVGSYVRAREARGRARENYKESNITPGRFADPSSLLMMNENYAIYPS